MKAPVIAVLLMLVSPWARAQPQPPAPPPPPPPPTWTPSPPTWTPPPPPMWTPPPCYPCAVAPPSAAELAELEQAARHKRATGIALMATGGGLIVAGTAMSIAGWWDEDDRCHQTYYGTYYYGARWCGDRALTIAGATTALIGAGSLGIGIPTYLSGNAALRRARWLQQRHLSLAPSLHPMSGGAFHASATLGLGF
jgi:hypothetical protein